MMSEDQFASSMYTVEQLLARTNRSRRNVLDLIRLYEHITGDVIKRAARKNFLTPMLTELQFQQLLSVMNAQDNLSYPERLRQLKQQDAPEGTSPQPEHEVSMARELAAIKERLAQIEAKIERLPDDIATRLLDSM